MVDVKTEILINLPKEIVSEFASDPENVARWCTHIKSIEWNDQHPLRAGTKILVNKRVMLRDQQHVYKVIEIIPGQKIVMRTISNGIRMETTVGLQAVNERITCMTLRNRGTPHAFSRAIAPFFALAIRKASSRDLKQLKYLLEVGNRSMAVL